MVLPYSIWWTFFIIGIKSGHAYEVVEFDVSETKIFTASLECSQSYRTTGPVECLFRLTNTGQRDYSVLKWSTPLEEELTADCLSVTRDGVKVPYDGIFVKRNTPGPDDFVLVAAGKTVSSTFKVSEEYDLKKPGTYSIVVDTYLEYAVGSVKSMNEPGKPGIPIKISHLSTPVVSFQVVGRRAGTGTTGQRARSLERENKRILSVSNSQKRSGTPNVPLDPVVQGNAAQQAETKEIHRAAYHYIKTAILDVKNSRGRAETWFGASSSVALETFTKMETLLKSNTITYIFGGASCQSNWYAYTWKGARRMHLCTLYTRSEKLSGTDNKMVTVVHELAHALAYIHDHIYGFSACKSLAKSAPNKAADNADNYGYFATTLFPFNYGFDAMTTLSNGYIYLFKGNIYARYTDSSAATLDPPYPRLIQGSWGNLPDNFAQGFDSFLYDRVNGRAYATKGNHYIRYTDGSASTVDGPPRDISTDWGVSGSFREGFDSMIQLANDKTYVSKGPDYIRYSGTSRSAVDSGYPLKFAYGWGTLPENFKEGFDAMEVFPDGKIYAVKGTEYIRFSSPSATRVDDGYPKPIKGHWGNVPQ